MAVFTLPPTLFVFYKHNIHAISNLAVQADRRRYALPDEAPRHYIDLDYYGLQVSSIWSETIAQHPIDSVSAHGILPWHLKQVKHRLTKAFAEKDLEAIIKISADAGHYLADAHVPLHTTSNYNGQKTGQIGIHGFWETRVPELLWDQFDLWVGKATYWHDYYCGIWDILWDSNSRIDSLLHWEKALSLDFSEDKKYSFEVRNGRAIRVYSKKFTHQYHHRLEAQVERCLRLSIKAVGDFWYTCWVDAGQPNLRGLEGELKHSMIQKHDLQWRNYHKPRDSSSLK